MKKHSFIFKTICIFVLALYVSILHAFNYSYKGVIFTCKIQKDHTVCITSYDRSAKNVIIPGEVIDHKNRKRYKVKSIDLHFNGYTYLTKNITICEGVEELEKMCFREFCDIQKIILPSSLEKIGKKMFCDQIPYDAIVIPTEEVKNLLVISGINYEKLPDPIRVELSENLFKKFSLTKLSTTMTHSEQRVDDENNLCALIKVTSNKQMNYISSYIPEPIYNYINFNKKGVDYIWMKDGATQLTVFSDKKEFGNIELNFTDISNGEITKVEAGYIYELKLEFNDKRTP